MFEGIMQKLGYVKEKEICGFDYLTNKEKNILETVNLAKLSGADLFVDYVISTNTQKFYLKEKGKKKALVTLEV